jgi:hypothetical protein
MQGKGCRITLVFHLGVGLAPRPLQRLTISTSGQRGRLLVSLPLKSAVFIFELRAIFDDRPTLRKSEWLVIVPGLECFQRMKCLHDQQQLDMQT